jgi:hypothetical protein
MNINKIAFLSVRAKESTKVTVLMIAHLMSTYLRIYFQEVA